MKAYLTLGTESENVRTLVADYARGLGCAVATLPTAEGGGIKAELPGTSGALLEVLTQVALSATRAGIDVTEPVCRVTYRHANASAEVTLGLRIADFRIDTVSTAS